MEEPIEKNDGNESPKRKRKKEGQAEPSTPLEVPRELRGRKHSSIQGRGEERKKVDSEEKIQRKKEEERERMQKESQRNGIRAWLRSGLEVDQQKIRPFSS